MNAGERPRRMSLSEVVELLLARGSSDHSSVSLTRNARGETQIEVTVRSGESGEVTNARDCARVAAELYDSLRDTYPALPKDPAPQPKSAD